jgi:hypothetical protein
MIETNYYLFLPLVDSKFKELEAVEAGMNKIGSPDHLYIYLKPEATAAKFNQVIGIKGARIIVSAHTIPINNDTPSITGSILFGNTAVGIARSSK